MRLPSPSCHRSRTRGRPQHPIKRRHRAVVADKRLERHGGASGIGQDDQPIPNLAQRQTNHAGRFIVRGMRRHQVDLNAHIHAALERGDRRSPAEPS